MHLSWRRHRFSAIRGCLRQQQLIHCSSSIVKKVNIYSPLARRHAGRNGIAACQHMGIDLLLLKDLSRASGVVEPSYEHRCFLSIFT
jgi:hypothetical protein